MDLRKYGWIWEGQGLDPGVNPSIFGVGEGAEYFGIDRVCYMFHPNDELAMTKLRDFEEVICDISKWKWKRTDDGGAANWVDSSPQSVRKEARKVGHLSTKFTNISGALHDDMRGLMEREGYRPEDYQDIYKALKSENDEIKLWAVVYSHELDEDWDDYEPFIDVVNLWVWNARDIPKLQDYIRKAKRVFPDREIVVGCYLRNYPEEAPVPMDMLRKQWDAVGRNLKTGEIDGYSILGTVLIDGHQEQANWIREFISRPY